MKFVTVFQSCRVPLHLESYIQMQKEKLIIKTSLLSLILLMLAHFSYSQQADSSKRVTHFEAAASVTNNGISLLPTFTLGKPAVLFDMSVGRRLTFEPQLRFSLEGKPWTFVFWWRYKLVRTDKFRINVGAHPALAFKPRLIESNGVTKEITVSQRYLAAELSPNYMLTKNISIGVYYLHGRGLEKDAIRETHFITVNSNFSNIKIAGKFFMKANPHIYYLKMDDKGGFYFTSTIMLARQNFPISVSSTFNKVIDTDISASKPFLWNATLTYSFSGEHARKGRNFIAKS